MWSVALVFIIQGIILLAKFLEEGSCGVGRISELENDVA